ncbi:LuxR C-terminal-related transcriptional regulator [Salmonella enterica]|nr:hypothetical protein [Salmonella enterica subsp. enterica serovar Newport str. CFSAN000599]
MRRTSLKNILPGLRVNPGNTRQQDPQTVKNMSVAPDSPVIIHGDNWPLVEGLHHSGKEILPEYRIYTSHTPSELLTLIYEHPDARLILCLQPREHIFLFYALSGFLRYTKATVVCDSVYFTDRVVMKMWNSIPAGIPPGDREELFATGKRIFMSSFMAGCSSDQPSPLFSGIFHDENDLTDAMNLYLQEYMARAGVSVFQRKILEALLEGKRTSCIAESMGVCQNKIENHKSMIFRRLEMPTSSHAILYGMRFHSSLQRTSLKEMYVVFRCHL